MPRPLRKTFEGAKYHVTCRGNGRQHIYLGEDDARRFREQLSEALEKDRVILYAWALMPNHYHLLVETPHGNLPEFMRRLNTAYALYFRYKRERPGHCFQGRYGAKLVSGDDYLLRLTRYIHLNPVKLNNLEDRTASALWEELNTYPWSSFRGYISNRYAEEDVSYRWLNLMHRKGEKENRKAYASYIRSNLKKDDDILHDAYEQSAYAIGDQFFIAATETEVKQMGKANTRHRDIVMPKRNVVKIEIVFSAVAKHFGLPVNSLNTRLRRAGEAKSIAIELACRLTGVTQREIGLALGISEHAIGKQRQRLAESLRNNKGRAETMVQLADRVQDL
jgi:REP element-mobilizing transposase RayT